MPVRPACRGQAIVKTTFWHHCIHHRTASEPLLCSLAYNLCYFFHHTRVVDSLALIYFVFIAESLSYNPRTNIQTASFIRIFSPFFLLRLLVVRLLTVLRSKRFNCHHAIIYYHYCTYLVPYKRRNSDSEEVFSFSRVLNTHIRRRKTC